MIRLAVASIVALSLMAPLAQADVTVVSPTIDTSFVQTGAGVLLGGVPHNVWEMRVTVHTGDWTNAELFMTLSSGHIYNHALGNNFAPNPAFVAIFPELGSDSFIKAGDASTVPTVVPPTNGLDNANATSVLANWGDVLNLGMGTFTIAQLTLSLDANGTIGGRSFTSINDFTDFRDVEGNPGRLKVLNGAIVRVPEPASLALLALGGLGLIARRRVA